MRNSRLDGNGKVCRAVAVGGALSTGMTLQRIDAELEAWDVRLAAIADNLLWLKSDSTYLSLKGAKASSQIRAVGKTEQYAEQALHTVPVIFDHFNLLHSTIDQAKRLREALPAIFGGEQKIAEVERLLHGKSIQRSSAETVL